MQKSKKIFYRFTLSIILCIVVSCGSAPDEADVDVLREMEVSLEYDVLKVWYPTCLDTLYGGYLCDFTYDWRDSWGTSPSNSQYRMYQIGSVFGFEPSFTVFDRFTFGSKFGIDCRYRKGGNDYHNRSGIDYDKSKIKQYEVHIIGGNFSASMRLYGYYEF